MRNLIRYSLPLLFLLIGGLYLAENSDTLSSGISVAVVCGGLLGVITFLRPEIGIYFILFSTLFFPEIPLGNVVVGLTSSKREIGIRPEDILIILIAAGWFTRLVIRRELMSIPQTALTIPIIIFSFIMIIATLSGALFGSVPLAAGFFYTLKRLEYFLVFFMVIINLKTIKEVKIGIMILLIASALVALYGIGEHLSTPEARVAGPFQRSQANILGGFFIITIFLALSFFLNYRSVTSRLGFFILLFISIYTAVWTRSRSTYTSLYIGLIIFSLLTRRPFLLCIPILLIIFQSSLLPERVQETVRSIGAVYNSGEINTSWESRINAWNISLPKILEQPFLGYGLGAFDLAWADNQYVHDALSIGLIGLGGFIWLIVRLFRSTWSMYRDSPELYNRTLAIGFISGLNGLLIQGIAVANFYTIRTMVPFWFLTGLVMVANHIEEESASDGKAVPSVGVNVIETT